MEKKDLKIAYPYRDIERFDGKDLAVFCYLYGLAYNRNIPKSIFYIHTHCLYQYLNIPVADIREALDNLSVYGIMQINKDMYALHQQHFFEEKKPFVLMSYNDVQKIIDSGYPFRYDILYLYFLIIRHVNPEIFVGDTGYFLNDRPIGYFAKILGVGNVTARKYIEILEEMEIIYIYRVATLKKPNLMGLITNRDLIYEYAQVHKIYERTVSFASVMLKYRALCSGKKYSDEELAEIRKGVERYNTFHPGKEKDMSVFS